MSRYLPVDDEPEEPKRVRSRRGWLFLAMGLAGILTVALIVTADESYAGIDGMRALTAIVPENEQDHPSAVADIPLLGGLVRAIHDLAPVLFAPATPPSADPAPSDGTAGASPRPAHSPSPLAQPGDPAVPAAQQPAVTTPPPSPAPSLAPSPSASPAPANTSAPFIPVPSSTPLPTATPTPTPVPTLAISTDRGGTAVVSLGDLVPGDSLVRTITVQNSGSLAFRYAVSATATASTVLWTDTSDGLQLAVETTGGTLLYSGPLSGLAALAGPTTLAPGTAETLRYTFTFPASAPNSFQGLVQDLTLVFDAVQYP